MSDNIFISYSLKDKHLIPKVEKELKRKGITSEANKFIDTQSVFIPGSNIRDALREAIKQANKVVLLWTEQSANSQWVNYEAGMAEALDKQIVIVVPKGSSSKIPSNLSELQILEIDMNG